MQITTTARHFDLTNAIRDHVEDSASKLNKYFDHILNAHFILSIENNRSKAEMVLNIPKNNFMSEATATDMYIAIDDAVDKMENQIKKIKDKWADHQKRSLKESAHFVYANLIEKGQKRKTVKTKRILAEVMNVHDAIDKFDDIKESYFIFKNEETDKINVLVRKDEEHYKLIEA